MIISQKGYAYTFIPVLLLNWELFEVFELLLCLSEMLNAL